MVAKKARKRAKGPKKTAAMRSPVKTLNRGAKPKLLSGGNPQIAKGDGDAPVQAYMAAIAGWKREVAAGSTR